MKYRIDKILDLNGEIKTDVQSENRVGRIGKAAFYSTPSGNKHLWFYADNEDGRPEYFGFVTSRVESMDADSTENKVVVRTLNSEYHLVGVEE